MLKKVSHVGHGIFKNNQLGLTIYRDELENEAETAVRRLLTNDHLPRKFFCRTSVTHLVDDRFIVKITRYDDNDFHLDVQVVEEA